MAAREPSADASTRARDGASTGDLSTDELVQLGVADYETPDVVVSGHGAADNGNTGTMALLTNILDERFRGGLLDDYGAPPEESTRTGTRGRHIVWLVVGVVVLGILLTVTAVQTRKSAPAASAERQSLVERVEAAQARTNALRADVDTTRAQVAEHQASVLAVSEVGQQTQQLLSELGAASGADPVSGPGVRVVIDDAPEEDDTDTPSEGRVIDIDLQEVVNGLWAAGAEAIAVDGQRVTSLSSIRMAGDAIFMDLQPLDRPYTIEAIGNPDALPARFVNSYGGAWMQTLAGTYGIRFEVTRADHLELPAAATLALTVAQPVATAAPTTAADTTESGPDDAAGTDGRGRTSDTATDPDFDPGIDPEGSPQ